jgi:hypothetical protein
MAAIRKAIDASRDVPMFSEAILEGLMNELIGHSDCFPHCRRHS